MLYQQLQNCLFYENINGTKFDMFGKQETKKN